MSDFTFIDLFAGIGGFHLGLTNVGGKSIGFSEIEKSAIAHYCLNHGVDESKNLGDITKVKELPKHDLLVAGVPCQSWSIAGRNLGFDDDRGQLWNDTVYLLSQSKPKAFIFENVKGLTDPRNKEAFQYILDRIKEAGYYASYYVLNSYDYGVLQNRVRVYIVGFREKKYFDKFSAPPHVNHQKKLFEVLEGLEAPKKRKRKLQAVDLFGQVMPVGRTKFQKHDEFNDFFLFNDIRNGHTTIHSWELQKTTDFEKEICLAILKNRRKKKYGVLDGNPLSFQHLKELLPNIKASDVAKLVRKKVLKEVDYVYEIQDLNGAELSENEMEVLKSAEGHLLNIGSLKLNKGLRIKRISFTKTIEALLERDLLKCVEVRYDFKHTKISSGINGVNRIYLPTSDVYSTLVASDTNDFVSTVSIDAESVDQFRERFVEEVYLKGNYRKISKEEACILQGFPADFQLPESRVKWMKLLGNSVSVPVIEKLGKQIKKTGVFD